MKVMEEKNDYFVQHQQSEPCTSLLETAACTPTECIWIKRTYYIITRLAKLSLRGS